MGVENRVVEEVVGRWAHHGGRRGVGLRGNQALGDGLPKGFHAG